MEKRIKLLKEFNQQKETLRGFTHADTHPYLEVLTGMGHGREHREAPTRGGGAEATRGAEAAAQE